MRVARRARWAARADRARKDAEAVRKLLADARRDAEKSVAEDEEKARSGPVAAALAALRLDDASLYQSKLEPLARRLGAVLGASLPGAPPAPEERAASDAASATTSYARDVDDFASAVAARATALRRDAGAKKAQKKKAFADLLRALPKLGVRSARRAVPDAEREPQAWFREPPVFAPDCFRRQHHSEESDELSEEELEGAAALRRFDEAEAYYCLLYTSPSPRDQRGSRMPSSA